MTRVFVLCCRPMHLSPRDAETWLLEQVGGVLADAAPTRIEVTTLMGASSAWSRTWDYLIAIELRDDASAEAAISGRGCAGLLDELRSLGMRRNVVVADDALTVVLSGERS